MLSDSQRLNLRQVASTFSPLTPTEAIGRCSDELTFIHAARGKRIVARQAKIGKSKSRPRRALGILLLGAVLLTSCSKGPSRVEDHLKQVAVGDTEEKVSVLLGDPSYTYDYCGGVTIAERDRERAVGCCSRVWVYWSLTRPKVEILVGHDHRVSSIVRPIGDAAPSAIPVPDGIGEPTPPTTPTTPMTSAEFRLLGVRHTASEFLYEFNARERTRWIALPPNADVVAPECVVPLRAGWASSDRGLSPNVVEVACGLTAPGSAVPQWVVDVPVITSPNPDLCSAI